MNKNILITILIGLVLIAVAFLLGRCSVKTSEPEVIVKTQTITKRVVDTIFVEKPKYITRQILDTIYIEKDTALLVEEKVYEDSISTLYISGVNCELDSIEYRLKKDCVIINTETTITKVEEVRSGWGITIGLYAGYGGYVNGGKVGVSPEVGLGGTIGWTYIFKHRKRAR